MTPQSADPHPPSGSEGRHQHHDDTMVVLASQDDVSGFRPVADLAQFLERRPADLLAELDRFDVYRGPTGRLRLVRPETAAKLIAAQLGEVRHAL